MRPLVLGTAGHIDHGKTALVQALTGTDTDRLPDEKRRGITIDLGFAQLEMADGLRLSVIDVPGHEAFVRNMLAGATGVDMALIVIAADEGPMPQTREHISILEHLGIGIATVAITKTDLVEPEWLELVLDEVRGLLADGPFAAAPLVPVSARTGAGLRELTAVLARLAASVPDRADADLFRMPIDRVFTVHGTGTVVTGTVWSGSLGRDEHVRILPGTATARVRGLQQHGTACAAVHAGTRAAIALSGVDRQALDRGHTLVTDAAWQAAGIITAQVRVTASVLRPRMRVRVHVGTAEALARVALLPADLQAGMRAIVQLRLESPIVTRAGDRLVLRSYSPVHTIAGGTVLEPVAPKRRRLRTPEAAALRVMASHPGTGAVQAADAPGYVEAAVALAGPGGLEKLHLPLAAGLTPELAWAAVTASAKVTPSGPMLLDSAALRETEHAIVGVIARCHREEPMADGIGREAVRRELGFAPLFDAAVSRLIADGTVVAAGNALAHPDHAAAPDAQAAAAMSRLETVFREAGLEAPDLSELPADLAGRSDLPLLIRFLERRGRILRLGGDRYISAVALTECVTAVRTQLSSGQPLGIADFRSVMNVSRKHLIPLLEHFDRTGVTRRAGENRVLTD